VKPQSASTAVKDALQVQAMVGYLKELDDDEALAGLFAGASDLTPAERRTVENEEAWILGVTRPGTQSGRIPVDVDAVFDRGAVSHV
jgi:hypothetical protein